ncbi:Uncharacterised protein [Mycobacterium xenopi]|uniref:Uncharacterized protein n=1 Tax=Mycobacterium xenopi TaxID=1789 RepID=A0AAD1H1Q3_MYCXE|nr:hypothetical protein I552_6273 [Mycobacterium xenopi 3993]BBU22811.1 hypothetical protein MYXE_26010 [Mycobacterium xenopi]SPX92785.1 Uncharacterised protein [Mycobacterium xenopi]
MTANQPVQIGVMRMRLSSTAFGAAAEPDPSPPGMPAVKTTAVDLLGIGSTCFGSCAAAENAIVIAVG